MCVFLLNFISIGSLLLGCLMGFGTLILTASGDSANFIFLYITIGCLGNSLIFYIFSVYYEKYEKNEEMKRRLHRELMV